MPPQTPMQPPMPEMTPPQPDLSQAAPELPPTPSPEPQMSELPPVPQNNSNVGHKKKLLNKLMENLLNKPGRSMHETISGVKSAISAFKNYSKEWDTLNGISSDQPTANSGPSMPASVSGSAGADKIKQIMQEIQSKKAQQPTDGGGGPGSMPNAPAMNGQAQVPPMAPLIAGQPQESSFNRPAPVSSLGIYGY